MNRNNFYRSIRDGKNNRLALAACRPARSGCRNGKAGGLFIGIASHGRRSRFRAMSYHVVYSLQQGEKQMAQTARLARIAFPFLFHTGC